ncbi:threonine synthase [Candidatus Thorarchaeota archaeon]|nr:MAG: threonine synthase [Candidatus Thorarchaeota archaeon]
MSKMSLLTGFKCTVCGLDYDSEIHLSSCIECGGTLEVVYDLERAKDVLTSKKLEARKPGVWQYFELLPIQSEVSIVSLGEGGTYLQKCDGLARDLELDELFLKDETTNPTGAFIDRGTAVEISAAKEYGIESVCCGSTGNLAASLVAYAARAGLESKVFIGQKGNVDIGKFYQILAYAADVEIVKDHDEALARARQESKGRHCVTSSNPHFMEGEKTTVYEICEQLGWTSPDWIIAPMGNGGHISMIWKGLAELQSIGMIDTVHTRIVGAQASGCAPIVEAFERGEVTVSPSISESTIAYDISVKSPLCGHTALRAITESNGLAISVSDKEILDAVKQLARREGVFAEPASATTIAALKKLVLSGKIGHDQSVVCAITGMGLKYPDIARTFVKGRAELERLLSRVEGRRVTTKLGQTKMRILEVLSKGESYGYGIWKELIDEYGMRIKIPSVYQHLSELTSSGLIKGTRIEQTYQRRQRSYYALTEKGLWTLKQLEKLNR